MLIGEVAVKPVSSEVCGFDLLISVDETATEAFSDEQSSLIVYSLAQMVDDIDNLTTWGGDSVTFSFPTEESDDYIGNSLEGSKVAFDPLHAAVARDVIALFWGLDQSGIRGCGG